MSNKTYSIQLSMFHNPRGVHPALSNHRTLAAATKALLKLRFGRDATDCMCGCYQIASGDAALVGKEYRDFNARNQSVSGFVHDLNCNN